MNKFDFDREISRRGTSSLKWDVGENELPMWVADMDFATAPCITEAIEKRVSHPIYGYSVVPPSLYKSYSDMWERRHGFAIAPDWMQFCTGVVPAISSIVKRITNVGDNIVVMTPVYDIFFHSIENFGRHTLECPLRYEGGEYSIDFASLEKTLSDHLSTMLILCNPHNPTGNVWSQAELKKVSTLCEKHGVTVLSDEIHCDIVQGKKYTPFALATGGKGITCISASKAFNMAGLQSAAVVVPDPILRNKVVRGLNSDEVAEPNCFAVAATEAALNSGEEWLDALNNYIAENKRIASKELAKMGLTATKSNATYLVWIDCSALNMRSDELAAFIRAKTGLYLSEGGQYRGNGSSFLRMNVACPKSRLLDGLDRLKTALDLLK